MDQHATLPTRRVEQEAKLAHTFAIEVGGACNGQRDVLQAKPSGLRSFVVFHWFSFADEHILNLLTRSLANPSLQVFVCCYSAGEYAWLSGLFKVYSNVRCITLEEGKLDFQAFNEQIFTISPPTDSRPPVNAEAVAVPGEGG